MRHKRKIRLAIGASGTGSCLEAVIKAHQTSIYDFEPVVAFTEKTGCKAMEKADAAGIPVVEVEIPEYDPDNSLVGITQQEKEFLQKLDEAHGDSYPFGRKKLLRKGLHELRLVPKIMKYDPDFIVLLGYVPILSPYMVGFYKNKILNTHPAPLEFQGLHGYSWAVGNHPKIGNPNGRNKWTCVTFHFVDEMLDHGPIIAQTPLEVRANTTEKSLARRGLPLEHAQIIQCLQYLATDRIILNNGFAEVLSERGEPYSDHIWLSQLIPDEWDKIHVKVKFEKGKFTYIIFGPEGLEVRNTTIDEVIPPNLMFTYTYRHVNELRSKGVEVDFNYLGLNIHPVGMCPKEEQNGRRS
ncbi:hypothetical protein D6745_01890 [Candidatus Woesearchaeota archaeon]|nr:MAG: hypothetical protein D6745_01890 [Candidatus Woesearchaeota archaeon]